MNKYKLNYNNRYTQILYLEVKLLDAIADEEGGRYCIKDSLCL